MSLLTGCNVLVYGATELVDDVADLVLLLGADPIRIDDSRALSRLAAAEVFGAIDLDGNLEGAGYPIVRHQRSVPESLLDRRLVAAELVAKLLAAQRGTSLNLDGPTLLTERMAHTNFTSKADASVGGSAVMVAAADGWMALNLARPDDIAALPALLAASGTEPIDPTDWAAVRAGFAKRSTSDLEEVAALLGMPIATVGGGRGDQQSVARDQAAARSPWLIDGRVPGPQRMRITQHADRDPKSPLVVDLSSLWAGPLCGRILQNAGCTVVKAESVRRPDGARKGSASFFAALNEEKQHFSFDHATEAGRTGLRKLIADADVVIDGSRPRVMDQWRIDRTGFVAGGGQWLSITGYGASGPWVNRVAFGDDAAASAGLVGPGDPPTFFGDAAADPISGLYAAVVVLAGLISGEGHHLDIALREAVAFAIRNP